MKPWAFGLLTVFNRCPATLYQVDVETHKQGYQNRQHSDKHVHCDDQVCNAVVKGFWMHEGLTHCAPAGAHNEPTDKHAIADHAKEELIVVEADTVGHPWTVVVHLQHAHVALGAVVTPIWFRFEAPVAQAHTAQFFLFV